MSFALDASTRVTFNGERFLHGWIGHQFSSEASLLLQLVARARQFSSFILLVGRVSSATTFEPRFGIIVQNKDLLTIPIMLDQIPTPKEFRDAIESLSPEQQRFARSFRGMQLESTLFGACVIQIKPPLEKLLKLPDDSLTKEIKLTQDLLSLFIEYQIPSDLLSYDGAPEAPTDVKLARVKEYVARMREMIDLSKQREIEEEREREALRLAEMNRTYAAAQALEDGSEGGGGPMDLRSMAAMAAPRTRAAVGRAAPPSMAMMGGPPAFGAPSPAPGGMPKAAPPAPSASMPRSPAPPPVPQAMQSPPAMPPPSPTPRPRDAAEDTSSPLANEGGEGIDYTRIPGELDRKLEAIDEDAALRATILTPDEPWRRFAQKGLLSEPKMTFVQREDLKLEKNKAFDLLDALTRSGAIAIDDASLHVVIAATHCFDRTLTETVIEENVNPIEKVERSLLILGTTIHGKPAAELLADDQRERFLAGSPLLGPARS